MPQKVLNKVCQRCNKHFLTYEADKNFCTDECKFKKLYCQHFNVKDHNFDAKVKNCQHCGEISRFKFCNKHCANAYARKEYKKESIKKSCEDREKPKRKGISYEELNRRAEWKRLNDDESWLRRFNSVR